MGEGRSPKTPGGVAEPLGVDEHAHVAEAADRVRPLRRGQRGRVAHRDPVDVRFGFRGLAEPPRGRLGERAAGVAKERDDRLPALESRLGQLASGLARLRRARRGKRERGQEGA